MTLATNLTLLRLTMIPVFLVAFYLPFNWSNEATTTIFALAAVTDWLDGYLARRLDQVSAFGAFLDPVVDKLIVVIALIVLIESYSTYLLSIPAAVIIGRELTVSALREWMAELGKRATVAVSVLGKVKTVAQMLALVFLLYREPIYGFDTETVGFVLLYVAAVLTLWSMVLYLQVAWPDLNGHGDSG